MTNAKYKNENLFLIACANAGIPATTRQASKFRNGKGLAYKVNAGMVKVLKTKENNFIKIVKQ